MRERFEDMSEEERRRAISEMGEGFGARRPGGRRGDTELSEEERARLDEERQRMRERWESMSDEEREEYRNQMRDRFGGGRRGGRGDMFRNLSEEDRERFQNMSEDERREYITRMRENRTRDANE